MVLGSAAFASAVFASYAHAGSLAVGDALSIQAVGVNDWGGAWASNTPQVNVNYSSIGPTNKSTSSGGENDYAGQIDWSGSVTSGADNGEKLNFLTYCVQLTTDIVVPSALTSYTVSDLADTMDVGSSSNSTKAAAIAALIANNPTLLNPAPSNTASTSALATDYMAFQVAIWDIVYNGGIVGKDIIDTSGTYGFNVSAGTKSGDSFNVSSNQSAIITQANYYLDTVLNSATGGLNTSSVTYNSSTGGYVINTGIDYKQTIFGLTSNAGTQDQSVLAMGPAGPSGIGSTTPLPASFAGGVALLGLSGLLGLRRKQPAGVNV